MAINTYILPRGTAGGGGNTTTLEATTGPKNFYGLSIRNVPLPDTSIINLENITGQRV